jgi:hypothetical protein
VCVCERECKLVVSLVKFSVSMWPSVSLCACLSLCIRMAHCVVMEVGVSICMLVSLQKVDWCPCRRN